MTDSLEDIEAEEKELLAQLAAKREQKAKMLEEAARKIKVKIRITRISYPYFYLRNDPYNNDVLRVLQATEGRIWNQEKKENGILLVSYENVLTQLKNLDCVEEITYNEGIEKQIHDTLYAPDYECNLEAKYLTVKSSRKASTYTLRQIPGYEYLYQRELHAIPLTEGWRLHEFATQQNNFVWSDSAKEFVLRQIESRLRLDEIAKAEDIKDFEPIEGLTAVLKNYQKVGIEFFSENGGRGILGDEMGTGKTLQMIALALKHKWQTLVVCPAPLKENWMREVRKFAPTKTTYTCQGISPTKFDIIEIMTKKPDFIIINYDILGRGVEETKIVWKNAKDEIVENPENKDLGWGFRKIVTERTRYGWVELFNLIGPDLCVMDEGHYIKNTDSNRSKAARQLEMKRSIAMSGTPILNRPGELWPLLHIADPITFPSFENFKRQYTFDGTIVRNVDELKQLLRPLMIRRLKKDVIKELEPINRMNSYYELSVKGRKLYDKVLSGIFEVLSAWNPNEAGSEKHVTNMLVKIQRLKQVVAYDGVEGTADLATEILDASPEGEDKNKVLIFSQFKATTYAISKRLGNEALSFVGLSSSKEFVTAQSHDQQRLIDRFQTDPSINFLCVTEKTAKEGHNITAAKAVIFNDLFWTPAGHQQAEARAYGRVSDLHTIDSYYRIGINSISEKIMDLLAAKLRIIEQVVEGVEASRADTSIIKELLTSLKEEMWTLKKKK